MKGDAFFFLAIFIFIFVIWVATGGPTRPISFAGPFLTPITATGETHGYYISKEYLSKGYTPTGTGGASGGNTDVSSQLYQAQTSATQIQNQIASLAKFGNPSVYRRLITISQVPTNAGGQNANQEYFSITLSNTATSTVNITGWTIESTASGKVALIPGGTTIPLSGSINAAEPILLRPGDTATIISGISPIGASFRTNLCIGYFAQYQKFYPALPLVCPLPLDEGEKVLTDFDRDTSCRAYLTDKPRCTFLSSPPSNLTTACTNFAVNDLNYNGCVQLHKNESAFNGTHWYVYLGRTTALWKSQYETIKVLDASGNTVSMYSY